MRTSWKTQTWATRGGKGKNTEGTWGDKTTFKNWTTTKTQSKQTRRWLRTIPRQHVYDNNNNTVRESVLKNHCVKNELQLVFVMKYKSIHKKKIAQRPRASFSFSNNWGLLTLHALAVYAAGASYLQRLIWFTFHLLHVNNSCYFSLHLIARAGIIPKLISWLR